MPALSNENYQRMPVNEMILKHYIETEKECQQMRGKLNFRSNI